MLQLPSSYQFTPKDLTGSGLAWKRVRKQLNGAQADFSALQVEDFGRVDTDRVWLVTQVTMQGTATNATEFFSRGYITENDANGTPVGLLAQFQNKSQLALLIEGETIRTAYLIQPGNHLRAFAHFEGATGNIIVWDVAGWLIPRANIEFAGTK